MSERLTDEQLRGYQSGRWVTPNYDEIDGMATELLALRSRVAKLEAALLDCKRYGEDHDDEWVPFRVDDALQDAP